MHQLRLIIATIALAGLATSAVDCGGSGASASAVSHEDALRHVRTALDAWKAGKVEDLAAAEPPIRFVDPDQAAGARLDDYTLGDVSTVVAHVVDVPVQLTLTDKKKRKTRSVSTAFQVVAASGVSVLRNDP